MNIFVGAKHALKQRRTRARLRNDEDQFGRTTHVLPAPLWMPVNPSRPINSHSPLIVPLVIHINEQIANHLFANLFVFLVKLVTPAANFPFSEGRRSTERS